MANPLPPTKILYQALLDKDSSFEGLFFVGVKTTGIFCRPTCTARKPKPENVDYFDSARQAILHGYRPCKVCRPLTPSGDSPDWLKPLLERVQLDPQIKLTDQDLRNSGYDPNRVRRWFVKHHGMTFQTYLRTLRIGKAFGRIRYGDKVIEAAFESGYESLSGFTDSFKKTTGFSPVKSPDKQLITITRILTPLGPMLAGATEDGICLLEFVDRRMLETQLKRLKKLFNAEFVPGDHRHFSDLQEQITQYFKGALKEFSIPLVLPGTEFQQKIWKILQTIPYGETRSYQDQAKHYGNPQAVRAVARANGDNRIGIIVPCHRVIGKNGAMVGYGGGIWRKKHVLDHEAKNR